MAKRNTSTTPSPLAQLGIDPAFNLQNIGTTTGLAGAAAGQTTPVQQDQANNNQPFTMTPQQVAGAESNGTQSTPSTSSAAAPTPYSTFQNVYSGDGGFNSSATQGGMDSLYIYSGAKTPVAVSMDRRFGAEGAGKTTTMNRYEMVTGTTMMQRYQHLAESDPTAFKALQNKLVAAGYLTKRYADGVNNQYTTIALQNLLTDASKYKDPTVTPDVLLQRGALDTSAGNAGTTSAYTRYNFSDPLAATDIGNKAAEDQLGHSMSSAQAQQFYAQLHAAQQANPAVTTTTYTEDPNSGYPMPSKQVDSQGGFNADSANQLATNWAQSQPDWATNQASTNLMSTLFKMLSGKV